jgi:streptogramin lyase
MNVRTGCLFAALVLVLPLRADLSDIGSRQLNFGSSTPNEVTSGADGTVWVLTVKGNLGKLSVNGVYTEFTLPWGVDQFTIPYAQTLTTGIDGNVWVVGLNGHIARVTPSGAVTDFTVGPSFYPRPLIVSGPDGALWFLDRPAPGPGASNAWKLGRIDIYGQVATYDLGISNDQLIGLVSGGDGNLWFIDDSKNQVVTFSLATNSMAGTFTIPSASNKNGDGVMTLGLDGNVWFTRGASIDRVGPDGAITEFRVPSGGQPASISTGGDGNLWFTEPSTGRIGQLVVSSVSGSTATINEAASVQNAYEMFALPSFVDAASKTAAPTSKPCPGMSFLVYTSPPPAVYEVTKPLSACADVSVSLSALIDLGGYTASVRVKNDGPDDAQGLTAVFNLSGADASVIQVLAPGDVMVSSTTHQVTLSKSTLSVGESFTVELLISNRGSAAFGGTASAGSATPDPNPLNNAAAFGEKLDSRGSTRVALNPADSGVVLVPVQR